LLTRPPRTGGGYRDYPPEAVARVRMVRGALGIGFSLAELASILKMRDGGQPPCREARRLAESKLSDVKRQLRELAGMRRQLERLLRDWDSRLAHTAKGQPARLLESLPDKLSGGKRSPHLTRKSKEHQP